MVTLTSEEQVVLNAAPVSAAGNPAGVDGTITWTVSDPALVTLIPNGFNCMVVTNGPLGSAVVTAEADADLGAGTSLIQGTFDVEVIAAPATSIVITAGDPTLKP